MKVVITNQAKLENQQNIDYLIFTWNKKVLENYLNKFDETINFLESGDYMGKFDEDLGLYKILVVKQIYLFYEIKKDVVLIVSIWNNYKNPYWL